MEQTYTKIDLLKSKYLTRNNLIKVVPFAIFMFVFLFVAYSYNNRLFTFLPQTKPVENTVEIVFKDKKFTQNFVQKYSPDLSTELVGFEDKEGWKGNFSLNGFTYYEGQTSLLLASQDRTTSMTYLERKFDLNQYDIVKMLVYIAKDEDNIESTVLRFSNINDTEYFEYPITNIKRGWNVVNMPKSSFTQISNQKISTLNWSTIEKVSIFLTARKNAKVEVNFDRMWAEKIPDIIKDDIKSPNYDNVSYKNMNGKVYLNIWNIGSNYAGVKKITSAKNFNILAKIIPQKKGNFGITGRININSGYGYYLVFDGVDTSSWRLQKYVLVDGKASWINLGQGIISNYSVEKDKPIWLKLNFSDSKISAYISIDGKDYSKLSEVTDGEFKSGGVSIYSGGGSILLENIEFTQ